MTTGLYPEGKLRPEDEGELNIGITNLDDGTVIMAFGKSIKWMGMGPDEARAIAGALLKYADAAERTLVRSEGH